MKWPVRWSGISAPVAKKQHDRTQLDELIASVDSAGFEKIRQRYADAAPYPGYSKYLDLDLWMTRAIDRAGRLDIRNRPPSRILDVGAGATYFAFVCAQAGHFPTALDQAEPRMYAELAELLGIPRVEHTINAFNPLPAMDQRFDLITAFSICFNQHNTPELWGPREWEFFLRDVAVNAAHERTEIYLVFNQERSGEFYSASLGEFFTGKGGSCDGDTVRLRAGAFR